MNFQRGFVSVIVGIVVLVAIVVGGIIYQSIAIEKPVPASTPPEEQWVGNDRDSHGCIGSAGYSWCEIKQKCLRVWEEKCEVVTSTSAIDTKGWKTYKSKEYGLEFSYPSDWIVEVGSGHFSISSFEGNQTDAPIVNPSKLYTNVYVEPITETKTLRELFENHLISKVYNIKASDIFDMKVGSVIGVRSNKVTYSGGESGYGDITFGEIWAQSGNKIYKISYQPYNSNLLGIFNLILSSFKFIPQ